MFISLPEKVRDLSGREFGRLRTLGPLHRRRNGHVLYACECECGLSTRVTCSNLVSGHTQSCGCLMRERTSEANGTHRRSRSNVYRVWTQMKQRCYLETAPNYRWYGARGIGVCKRWRDSFEAFLEDMGEPPPGHELDRIDNDGDYEPGNCRWVTHWENIQNSRTVLRHRGA